MQEYNRATQISQLAFLPLSGLAAAATTTATTTTRKFPLGTTLFSDVFERHRHGLRRLHWYTPFSPLTCLAGSKKDRCYVMMSHVIEFVLITGEMLSKKSGWTKTCDHRFLGQRSSNKLLLILPHRNTREWVYVWHHTCKGAVEQKSGSTQFDL